MQCDLPRASVQTGTATSTAGGAVTQTIQSIDPAASFLIFQTRSSGNRPPGVVLGGRIVDATTIEFNRNTDGVGPEPVTIDVTWYVVSYPAECVRVQRGIATPSALTVNTSINAVASTENAFVTFSATTDPASGVWDNNNPISLKLTSTTNLRMTIGGTDANTRVYWQVIEFLQGQARVQSGTTAMSAGTSSVTATLTASVDLNKSFVLSSLSGNFAGANIAGRMIRSRLTSPTTLVVDRDGTADIISEVAYSVVEFRDGTSVQTGTASFPTGTTVVTVPVSRVDPVFSFPLSSVMIGGGQGSGKTPYTADDIPGISSATMLYSGRELTLTRSSSVSTADIQWYLIQAGRCPTCDISNMAGQ